MAANKMYGTERYQSSIRCPGYVGPARQPSNQSRRIQQGSEERLFLLPNTHVVHTNDAIC